MKSFAKGIAYIPVITRHIFQFTGVACCSLVAYRAEKLPW